uniref:Homeobox domain-containing protein n=1 Tax=Globodera pallida TaxID=36090 RepID=A0A183CG88_GLOPA
MWNFTEYGTDRSTILKIFTGVQYRLPNFLAKNLELGRHTGRVPADAIGGSVGGVVKNVEDEQLNDRRYMSTLNERQLELLEKEFASSHYPACFQREVLADKCQLTDTRVQVWFSNRRAKYRRQQRAQLSSDVVFSAPR